MGVLSEAPAEVRGMVRDRDTDRGIPGSIVELRIPRGELIQKGQVGRRGNYVLPLIRPGSYQLTANVPGYGDPDGVGLDLGSGELRTIHFWMSGNQPPSFRPVDPVGAIPEGSDFELHIQAVDLDGDPITLEASVPSEVASMISQWSRSFPVASSLLAMIVNGGCWWRRATV